MQLTRTATNNAIDYNELAKVIQAAVYPMINDLESRIDTKLESLETRMNGRFQEANSNINEIKENIRF